MSEPKRPSSDELALQRTSMASERTFMAWTRTALSLISFGFAIPKVAEAAEKGRRMLGDWSFRAFGIIMVALGVFVLVISSFDHWKQLRKMKEEDRAQFRSSRLSYVVASVLTVLGALALANLIFSAF